MEGIAVNLCQEIDELLNNQDPTIEDYETVFNSIVKNAAEYGIKTVILISTNKNGQRVYIPANINRFRVITECDNNLINTIAGSFEENDIEYELEDCLELFFEGYDGYVLQEQEEFIDKDYAISYQFNDNTVITTKHGDLNDC